MRRPSLSRPTWLAIGAAYLLFVLYSLVIRQTLLVGLVFPALLLAIGYLCWRVGRIVLLYEQQLEYDSVADQQQRPVDSLKQRYADGELSEEEFEQAIEEQLKDRNTDTVADSEEQSIPEQERTFE